MAYGLSWAIPTRLTSRVLASMKSPWCGWLACEIWASSRRAWRQAHREYRLSRHRGSAPSSLRVAPREQEPRREPPPGQRAEVAKGVGSGRPGACHTFRMTCERIRLSCGAPQFLSYLAAPCAGFSPRRALYKSARAYARAARPVSTRASNTSRSHDAGEAHRDTLRLPAGRLLALSWHTGGGELYITGIFGVED